MVTDARCHTTHLSALYSGLDEISPLHPDLAFRMKIRFTHFASFLAALSATVSLDVLAARVLSR